MKTILIALHSSQFSGAPLAGVTSAVALRGEYRVMLWTAEPPVPSFAEYCRDVTGDDIRFGPVDFKQFDLVIAHSAALAPLVDRLIIDQIKVLWWIHEDLHFFDVCPNHLINKCLLNAYAIAFVSSHCAHQTFRNWVDRRRYRNTFIIPNTRPPSAKEPDRSERSTESIKIGHYSASPYVKGTDRVIEIAYRLSFDKRYRFVIIGNNPLSRLSNLPSNIEFTGEVSYGDSLELLAGCSLLLQPSRLDNQPLSIIEALFLGIPVITSGMPSMREFASPENGYFEFQFEEQVSLSAKLFYDVAGMKGFPPSKFTFNSFQATVLQAVESLT